ncbi:DnaK suppressor protein [Natronocella acetinitrilica]|uniref:DnaK suppressor protein n=1 Tax=Natronocella acetinitrilica TaxID=414046 RepID=A0AAE3G303_9GAMM|nr:TraR/DksA family transcriptional regulator [Natronocella acetinitrilica]MCP1672942.1 DnaK suppressor protein [Natronocella acetinitrilica]
MLSDDEIELFRERLEQSLAALEGNADIRKSSAETVELDQTRTGRLSRMDALQGQAMARATEARALQQAQRIRAALRRIEEGTYGDCVKCEEPIAVGRLRADPAALVCIACAELSERR